MQQKCGVWELSQEIGRGAYGVVYMATGPGGERAAVKVCRRDDAGDERYGRELRGAKLFMSLSPREGLVRMRELAEEEWGFYTVMDLADDEFGGSGGTTASYRPKTLARVIEGEKALPLRECVKLAITLAKGLVELQRHHLLHRDIKPANVLYVGGRPVLSDPGLVVEETVAVSTVGTPGYVPPERKFTDAAGDIYSLGLTLKAASFGRQLEDLDKGPAMEADTGSLLFPAWWRILNKATDPSPSRRHQSAKAFLNDLKALRRKMALAAVVGSRSARVAIALFALGVVAVLVYSVGSSRHLKKELAQQVAEVEPLKKFKVDAEKTFKRADRYKQWERMYWNISSTTDYYRFVEAVISNVAKTNQVRAVEMRSQYDKLVELEKQHKDLASKINALFKVARKKGLENADDEFSQANQMYSERKKVEERLRQIRKGFGLP